MSKGTLTYVESKDRPARSRMLVCLMAWLVTWLIATSTADLRADDDEEDLLAWESMPAIPPAPGQDEQAGLAGPFAGVHADALIVAGGANFPGVACWDGGTKVWWDDVYVLVRDGKGGFRWHDETFKLDWPAAYGASVSTNDGLVCIGGCDKRRCFADVFRLRWISEEAGIEIDTLPSLPVPLADMGGVLIGRTIYVAGGRQTVADAAATTCFFALDLSKEGQADEFKWRMLPSWPGPPRVLPVVAAQSDGASDCLFLFSGRNAAAGKPTELLVDGYKYEPLPQRWTRLADVAVKDETAKCVMGAPAIAWGANHILVFGGDDGRLFMAREKITLQHDRTGHPDMKSRFATALRANFTTHPGFTRDVLAYHTVTNTWTKVGQCPQGASQAVTTAVRWGDAVIIPSGEIRPGVRTPDVMRVTLVDKTRFGTLNYAVLGVYLAALIGMGFYFARRGTSTEDFFKAGGRIPWWAAGISIFGTTLSAITYMSLPGKTFATDWRYMMLNVAIVVVAPFVVYLFLPFFRRLNVTTAYEYLEQRFNLAVRLLASVLFVLMQFGRIGIVLYLPALALSVVTSIDVNVCILLMGVLCIFYTTLGGIEAVIWTDVIQVIVLMGGALFCLVLMSFHVPGGWNGACEIAEGAGKFRTFDFRFDLTTATFFVLLFGGFADKMISYGTDQSVIQRYLTTKDEAAARRGIWLNAIIAMPATLLFFGLGSMLYAFYQTQPAALSPAVGQQDAIFPWYIVTQLPAGVAGLLIAGLFAASMSSLDSSMNSVATAVTTDFYRRFRSHAEDRTCLKLARWITVLIGVAGTALALVMAQWNIKSLWDQMVTVLGLFGGGLAGLFLLAIFTRRTSGAAALAALLGSSALQFVIKQSYPVHPSVLPVSGIVSCLILGLGLSAVLPNRKPVDGLTIHTLAGEIGSEGVTG